jgi:hypothetical protein
VITRGRVNAHRENGDDLRAGRGMLLARSVEATFNMVAWLLVEAASGDVRRLPEGLDCSIRDAQSPKCTDPTSLSLTLVSGDQAEKTKGELLSYGKIYAL